MSWPASQATVAEKFQQVNSQARSIRRQVRSLRTLTANGSVARSNFVNLLNRLDDAIVVWSEAATVSGLATYARDQFADPSIDVVAEFQAMVQAAQDLKTWIINAFPKDAGSGAWLLETVDASGERIDLLFTTQQTASFRTQADAFLATID